MLLISPPFVVIHANGPPGPNIPHLAWYYDTSVTPPAKYVYHAGSWHKITSVLDINATAIWGTAINATPPTVGQMLTYVSATPEWKPQ
ncbi:MAG TPA: hypothetical protein VIY48_08030 [Candidatus Paceibacterota bacterium]